MLEILQAGSSVLSFFRAIDSLATNLPKLGFELPQLSTLPELQLPEFNLPF